ncbi:MAG TPA: hypothetical protein VF618_20455 [Thermoanaerobaculia bacterium]
MLRLIRTFGIVLAALLLSGAVPAMAAVAACPPHACCASQVPASIGDDCCDVSFCAAPEPRTEEATVAAGIQLVAVTASETTVVAAAPRTGHVEPSLHPKGMRMRLAELSLLRI